MKTKTKIIQETVDYYSADPTGRRAMNGDQCEYCTDDGRKCAVGRCIAHVRKRAFGCLGIGSIAEYDPDLDQDTIDPFLKVAYRGHDLGFWDELQKLHDDDDYWDDNGLSAEGNFQVSKLLEKYS